jgi:tetratricopeptide (TPR) repeat protein
MVEGGAFLEPKFADLAKEAVLFCHVTSQVPDEPHPKLMEEKGGLGFPYMAILDSRGALIAAHRGARTVEAFGRTLAAARKLVELRPKADGGDRPARLESLKLLLDNSLVGLADAEFRLREIGEPGADGPRIRSAIALLRLGESADKMIPAHRLRDAELALEFQPDSEYARYQAVDAAMALSKHRKAVAHLPEARRRFPAQTYFIRVFAEFYAKRGFTPVTFELLREGQQLPDQGGAPFREFVAKMMKAYAPSGGEAWEIGTCAAAAPGCDLKLYRSAGTARDPNVPWDEQIVVCRKDGIADHAIRHVRSKGLSQLWLVTLDTDELVRETKESWTAKDLESMVTAVHAAMPKILEARRFAGCRAWPLVAAAAADGLRADPENAGLKKTLDSLSASGWDSSERESEKDLGEGRRVAVYRATGKAPPAKSWLDERVAVVTGPDGAFVRSYVVQTSPGAASRYLLLRDDQGGLYIRKMTAAPSADDLIGAVVAGESAIEAHRAGQEALAQAQKYDFVVAEFDEALAHLRKALKADPKNLAAADELNQCYLAITDRERDPDRLDAVYPKAVGALLFLAKLDPAHPNLAPAGAIYSYRFLNYPYALAWLKAGTGDRVQEILGLLRNTGQGEYKLIGTSTLDGLQVESYQRVHGTEEAEKGLDGLQLVERCFVGTKDGLYKFTAAYRIQKIGGTVQRELLLNRYERSFLVRNFDAEPTADQLQAEVTKAVQSLKSGK